MRREKAGAYQVSSSPGKGTVAGCNRSPAWAGVAFASDASFSSVTDLMGKVRYPYLGIWRRGLKCVWEQCVRGRSERQYRADGVGGGGGGSRRVVFGVGAQQVVV